MGLNEMNISPKPNVLLVYKLGNANQNGEEFMQNSLFFQTPFFVDKIVKDVNSQDSTRKL